MVYAVSKLIGSVADIVSGAPASESDFYLWLIVLALGQAVQSVYYGLYWRINHVFQDKVGIVVYQDLFSKMYELSQEQFDDQDFNIKSDRARSALSGLVRSSFSITTVVSAIIQLVFALLAIAFVAHWIVLLVVLPLVLSTLIEINLNIKQDKLINSLSTKSRLTSYSSRILISPKEMAEVRLVNAFQAIVKYWRKSQKEVNSEWESNHKRQSLWVIGSKLVESLAEFIAMVLLFWKLILGKEPNLQAFIFARGLVSEAGQAARSLVGSISESQMHILDLRNVEKIKQTKPAIVDGQIKVGPPFSIEFKNVSFTYPKAEVETLHNVSFKIEPREHLAIVGANGSGKTTILKLLLRQYLPDSGQVEVNRVALSQLKRDDYYKSISYLGQEFFIIHHLTIRQNMLISQTGKVDEQDIWAALKLAQIDTFIKNLPKGLETRLQTSFKDGRDLSFGQQQRICIARTFLNASPLLVLDEPTSSIDAEAEIEIFNNIYQHRDDKSILAISHKFNTVRAADRILVVEKGEIIERGSHQELMNQGGLYHKMFNLQVQSYMKK